MDATRHRWLIPALERQSLVARLVIGCFILLAILGVRFSLMQQIGVLLAGIILLGFPHGAFDHLVARPLLAPRLGRLWWGPFGAAYLGLAGLVWTAWIVAPLLTLVLFLAGSVLHFGLGDTEDSLDLKHVPRWGAILILGAVPILLPIAFHPEQAAPLLGAIGDVTETAMAQALSLSIWLIPAWIAAFLWMCWAGRQHGQNLGLTAVTAFGFVLLPPLLAFGLYFGLVHSPRHLLRLGAWHDPWDLYKSAIWAARVVVPAAIFCALGIGGLALAAPDLSIGLMVPIFRIIAALTLPHMIVTSWLGKAPETAQVFAAR